MSYSMLAETSQWHLLPLCCRAVEHIDPQTCSENKAKFAIVKQMGLRAIYDA